MSSIYHIAQNSGGEKLWGIVNFKILRGKLWRIAMDYPCQFRLKYTTRTPC